MKRVLIITYYWPPSGGAGVQRWVKFVKYLPQYGWEPIVLTVDPSQATYPQKDESLLREIGKDVAVFHTPTREIYSLYKKVSSNKEVPYGGFANTTVLDRKEKIMRFIRGNFFLPDPRRGWNRFAYRKAKDLIATLGITHVVTTSPPHSTQLIGLKLKKKLNIVWVADLRDPWTDIYYSQQLYPAFWASMYNRSKEKKVIQTADKVLVVSLDMKNKFLSKIKVPSDKIEVVHNGFDEEDFIPPVPTVPEDRILITYAGTIAAGYSIDGLLQALSRLPDNEQALFHFRFIGKISAEIQQKFFTALPETQFESLGYVDHAKIPGFLVQSSALLLVIPDSPDNKGILTGKLFEYLASHRPVLLLGPLDGDAADIIRETESGYTCDPDDVLRIVEILKQLIHDFTFQSDKSYGNSMVSGYSRKVLTAKLSESLNLL